MPYRQVQFAPDECYHLCVRGNNKQNIFRSDADRARMLFLVTHLQSPETIAKISRVISDYRKFHRWNTEPEIIENISAKRYVALQAFAFMTNHIHLSIQEREERGTTRYMQRVLNAYAKYFNTKYEMVGHLFQGPFHAVHVTDNEQLLYLSSYIHRNPRELPRMAGKEHAYEWSSYRDYLGENRFGALLDTSLVLEQFKDAREYQDFVDTSPAKEAAFESFVRV